MGEKRARNWSWIIYPESAPNNWEDLINEHHIKWAHSPVHDKDVYDKDVYEEEQCVNTIKKVKHKKGEKKKAHIHCVAMFEGKKSKTQIEEILKDVNASLPIVCNSVVGMVRYFVHLDNTEKAQYKIEDIKSFCNFDIRTPFEDDELYTKNFNELVDIIVEHSIDNVIDLRLFLKATDKNNLMSFMDNKAMYAITQYVKAQNYRNLKYGNKQKKLKDWKPKTKNETISEENNNDKIPLF